MTIKTKEIKMPAKLNLILQITGKRVDGYHFIDSIMQSIDLYDTIKITIKENSKREKNDKPLIKIKTVYSKLLQTKCPNILADDLLKVPEAPEKNICGKVALKFIELYKLNADIDIKIKKCIPIGAGLGGGSADGAGVALLLNELFDLQLSNQKLCAITKDIGADIPFNIYRGSAIVSGIGEKIKILTSDFSDAIKKLKFILVYPNIHCATKEVYKNFKFCLTNEKKISKIFIRKIFEYKDIKELEELLVNDLSATVYHLRSDLAELKRNIETITNKKVFMSGSGSTLFLMYDNDIDCENNYRILKTKLKDLIIYKTQAI